MRTETRTIYTLAELKQHKPEAYARVLKRWQDACDRSGDVPWASDTMVSLKAVVKACEGKLLDWSISAYGPSSVKVEADDYLDDGTTLKDSDWLRRCILKPNGYTAANGHATFPGVCKWTGYYADDDMIEAVWEAMRKGATLTQALGDLAGVAQRLFAADAEQQRDAETMEANWDGNEYDEHGADV